MHIDSMTSFLRRARSFMDVRTRMTLLALRAAVGRRSVTGDADVVVSLTTFGVRTRSVHLAIESIARGSVRPRRLVLWLDDEAVVRAPTAALRRAVRRGLELRHCPDIGPHKKYFPYVQSVERHVLPLVTADDDVLYPSRWLEHLLDAHARRPDAIHAHRVDRAVVVDGDVAPYETWDRAADPHRPSPRNLAVGIKGILYPAPFLAALRAAGPAFRAAAPRSSDFWLHHMALRDHRAVLPVTDLRIDAVRPMRGVRRSPALADENVAAGRNDRLLREVFGPDEIDAIVADDPSLVAS